MDPEDWPYHLTLDEVAHILRCCTKTVRRLIDRGKLEARRIGSQLRVRRPDLERCLDEARVRQRPPRS